MDINTILQKWQESKMQIRHLTKQCDQYKGAVQRYMDKKHTDTIEGTYLTITRRNHIRQSLLKTNVPPDMWEKYSTRNQYNSYYIKKTK